MSDESTESQVGNAPEQDSAKPAPPSDDAPVEATGEGDDAMAAAALEAATAAVEELSEEATGAPPADGTGQAGEVGQAGEGATSPLPLPELGSGQGEGANEGLTLLDDVALDIRVELGRTVMLVEDVLKLGGGAVVELDKLAGDPVDIYANGRHIARGEVLVLNDNFCIRVNEIIASPADDDEGEADAA